MASGGNMTPGTNVERAQYTQSEMRAIVEEAHRLGVRVTAHAHGVEGIRHALAGGVDMLEHCSFQTPDGSEPVPEVIQEIAETGTIVSPTIFGSLWGQENTQQYKKRATLTQDLIESGARMLMSTDCGIPHTPHENLSYSLEIMQNLSRLEPVEVLQLSTNRSAELLGLPDRGRIEPGLRADLVALSSDPTDNLSALREIEFVVCGGDQIPT
jgi:imidazolonepropionase-like amidohydrolase